MFPPGAKPEEQAAQGIIWQAVIFWAALCYHLPLLASIEGETASGFNWQPAYLCLIHLIASGFVLLPERA